jgi:hypothetical protein
VSKQNAADKLKKKFKIVAHFSWSNSTRFPVHVSHTFHHVLTTKTPSQSHPFLATPLEKPSKIVEKQQETPSFFFLTNSNFSNSPPINSPHLEQYPE